MLVYVSSLFSSCVLAIALKNKRLRYGKKTYSLFWFAMIPLVLVGSLRYRVGTDYTFYLENQFQIILKLRQPDYWQVLNYEIGFEKLVEFCGNYLGNVELFFPIVSISFLFFVTLFISDQSENRVLSIILLVLSGFYNFSFNIIRQTLATAIFLFGIRYIQQRKLLKYGICILAATAFHKMAILYLPVYFLVGIEIRTAVRFLLVPSVYLLQMVLKKVIIFFCNMFNFYKGYINLALGETSKFPISLTLTYIGIYYLVLLFVPEEERMTPKGKLFSILETLSIIVVLCGSIAQESTRIIYMFFPVYIVSIPYWFNRFEKTKIATLGRVLVILLAAYLYIYYIPLNNYGSTLPYQTIFSK